MSSTPNGLFKQRVLLFGVLAVCVIIGGSPIKYSQTSSRGVAMGMKVTMGEQDRVLWKASFRDPALVVFRYPNQTRYGLVTKLRVEVLPNGGVSSEYSHTRTDNPLSMPEIAEVQATGNYIVCEVELDVLPRWKLFEKAASFTSKTRAFGVGKFKDFQTSSSLSEEITAVGVVSHTSLSLHMLNRIESQFMRAILRDAVPTPQLAKTKSNESIHSANRFAL